MDMNQLQPKNMTIEALPCQIKKRLNCLRPTSNANIGTAATDVSLETSTIDRLFSFDDSIISAGVHYLGKT